MYSASICTVATASMLTNQQHPTSTPHPTQLQPLMRERFPVVITTAAHLQHAHGRGVAGEQAVRREDHQSRAAALHIAETITDGCLPTRFSSQVVSWSTLLRKVQGWC